MTLDQPVETQCASSGAGGTHDTHAHNAATTSLAIAIGLSAAIRVHFLGHTRHQVLL
jgi:hypothetical protein